MSGGGAGEEIHDWKAAIDVLIRLHQHIRDLDYEGLWAPGLPRQAAAIHDVAEVERTLELELDVRFKAFLLHADGWPSFYQWVDLFGTNELLGQAMRRAQLRLVQLEQNGVLQSRGFWLVDMMPIAMTGEDHGAEVPDLFVQVRGDQQNSGEVLWYSDEEVDCFRDFDDFFLAMLDYNREEIKDLLTEAKERGRIV